MKVDTRLIISHHPKVETFRDVAYDIECFYKLQDEMATAVHQLRVVSDLPPQEMRMEPAPPKCTYRVENGNATAAPGELISTVFIGDTVTHVWSCDEGPSTSFQMYCIHVHDCIAKGEDEEISVVDSFGCATESDLLSPLVHSPSSTRVSAVSRVFKFPNSTGIYFDCQISFTLRVHEESKTCPTAQCVRPSTRQKRSTNEDQAVESQELTVLEDRLVFLSPKVAKCDWLTGPFFVVSTLFFVYFVFTFSVWLTPRQ